MLTQPEFEVCPSCGEFVDSLVEDTGWCSNCSHGISDGLCSKCHAYPVQFGKVCNHCKLETFLAENADHIEHYLSKGYTVTRAIILLRADIRPHCVICGGLIKRAPANSLFCTKHLKCRTMRRRYIYLTYNKKLPANQALAQIQRELE